MKAFFSLILVLIAPSLAGQEGASLLITEHYDPVEQNTVLSYSPNVPTGSPITSLRHPVGTESVVMTYTHRRSSTQFQGVCSSEGRIDGVPIAFPSTGDSDVQPMRQGVIESVSWVIPLDLLRRFANGTTLEVRHCGTALHFQPSITLGAAEMLRAIDARVGLPQFR